jgi:DNA-binding transcriptional MerR regulator
MGNYTVKQLARLSGVSVRTLHHYDEIGLLKPAFTGENRYRYYGREELLRLQDILFHRELSVPLADISRLLETEGRDRVAILAEHRELLADRVKRSRQLLRTIDRTIAELTGEGTMDDKDIYKGFAPEKQAQFEEELVEHLGEGARARIEHSKAKLGKLGKEGMAALLEEGGKAEMALAERFRAGDPAESAELAPAIGRHRAWVGQMWDRECPPQAYFGLADLYVEHPGFRARYEAHGEGFTDWLARAMKAHAARLIG